MSIGKVLGIAAGILVAFFALCGIGTVVIGSATDSDPKPTASWTSTPNEPSGSGQAVRSTKGTPPRGNTVRQYGDGQYEVGKDIPAGRYKTAGPEEDAFSFCYWERTRDTSGGFGSIIANETVKGQGYATLKTGEYFKTSGCKPWVKG